MSAHAKVETNFSDDRAAAKLREYYKMAPIKTGFRDCLRCEKKFFSEDLKAHKMCHSCRDTRLAAARNEG